MKGFISFAAVIFLIASCQKGFVDATVTPPINSGGGNGDLLIKGISITGTDTTTVYLQWDVNKRLTQYLTTGKTNGVITNSRSDIARESNGNIRKIISFPANTGGLIDSIVTYPFYQSGTAKLAYAKSIKYTFIGDLQDSILFTYNSANEVSVKETYSENFLTSVLEKQSKSTYTYDSQGNLLTTVGSAADANGVYTTVFTITNTYDAHLAPATFGDEVYLGIGLGDESVSLNNITKKIQQGSGANYTFTISQQQFNTFNRSTSGIISVTPVPPGYTVRYTYFYQ